MLNYGYWKTYWSIYHWNKFLTFKKKRLGWDREREKKGNNQTKVKYLIWFILAGCFNNQLFCVGFWDCFYSSSFFHIYGFLSYIHIINLNLLKVHIFSLLFLFQRADDLQTGGSSEPLYVLPLYSLLSKEKQNKVENIVIYMFTIIVLVH